MASQPLLPASPASPGPRARCCRSTSSESALTGGVGLLALVTALLCVVANAFFVAAEFAMARVRSTALEARAQSGDRKAERALQITRQLDAYLTATQFGITLASLALGWLGEPAVADLVRPSLTTLGISERALH